MPPVTATFTPRPATFTLRCDCHLRGQRRAASRWHGVGCRGVASTPGETPAALPSRTALAAALSWDTVGTVETIPKSRSQLTVAAARRTVADTDRYGARHDSTRTRSRVWCVFDTVEGAGRRLIEETPRDVWLVGIRRRSPVGPRRIQRHRPARGARRRGAAPAGEACGHHEYRGTSRRPCEGPRLGRGRRSMNHQRSTAAVHPFATTPGTVPRRRVASMTIPPVSQLHIRTSTHRRFGQLWC